MRCLYCNKKLSLLKLAKGDSFCSPQHFDAHQLQLSKDAFDRLSGLTAEDTPKAPLIVKAKEEIAPRPAAADTAPDDDAHADQTALQRLTAFAPPSSQAAAEQVPPYAPFASAPFAPFWLDSPPLIASGPEAEEAVEPPQDLALPVHDAQGVACILNLYLRLSLAETEPSDWTPPRDVTATPEEFHPEINQPPLVLSPEFPHIENLAPVDAEPPIEALRPVDTAPLVEAVAPDNGASPTPKIMPSEAEPIAIARQRVPFHVAPSFRERIGSPILIHSSATSAALNSTLSPVLENGSLPRLDSCDSIPNAIQFADNAVRIQNSTHWIKSDSELLVESESILPDAKPQVCQKAWRPSQREISVVLPTLDANWEATRPLGFDLPVPDSLMTRPVPVDLTKVDPQRLLDGAPMHADSLFHEPLQTPPLGKEPLVIDRPAAAMKSIWQAALAPFPERKPFPAAWEHRVVYSSLRDPIAEGFAPPMGPLDQRRYPETCIKIDPVPSADLPKPYVPKDWYRPTGWPQSDLALIPLSAEPGLPCNGSSMLPQAADLPGRSLSTGPGSPKVRWDLHVPAPQAPLLVKFLLARDGVVLPSAKEWQRLDSVPR